MDIAWITPKWPFPVTDGARVATTQLLKNLSHRKMRIHLYAIIPQGEAVDTEKAKHELGVDEITLVYRTPSTTFRKILSAILHPFTPITLTPYTRLAINLKTPDLVVYDGLHAAAWTLAPSANLNCLQAYRAHNVESDIWFRAAEETRNPLKKVALHFQGHLVKRMESRLVRRSNFIFPVSDTDAEKFKAYETSGEIRPLPIGMQAPEKLTPFNCTSRNILFVGRLDWPPNREGLERILDRVWPKVMERNRDLSLTIVGSGNSSWLEPFRNHPGINLMGEVKDLTPYYEDCIATVVPVFYGSGTRVKAIESSLYGRACVSTELGVEGIGLTAGETYFRAETVNDWIETLTSLEIPRARVTGEKAREHAEGIFHAGRISERFIESISR